MPSEESAGAVTVEERGAPSQGVASKSWLTSSPAASPSLKMLSRTDALGFFLRPRSLGVRRSFAGLISLRRIESATTALNPPDRVENKGPGEKCAEMEFRGLRGGVCGTVLFRELFAGPSTAPVLSASGAGGKRRSTVELAAFCRDCSGGVTGRSISESDAVRSKVSAQGFLSRDEGWEGVPGEGSSKESAASERAGEGDVADKPARGVLWLSPRSSRPALRSDPEGDWSGPSRRSGLLGRGVFFV